MRAAALLVSAACLLGACSSAAHLRVASPAAAAPETPVVTRDTILATVVLGEDVAESAGPVLPRRPRNLVLFIADGFGPASATLGRAAKGAPLSFDSLLVGAVETSASDSRVTDSAASATAYACGVKTYNGAIGVGAGGAPCTTILERAEAAGLSTGLVATSRITHATPASFAAHVAQRSQEAEIAEQMLASGVDLLLGGGRSFFSDREDGRDLLAARREVSPDVLAVPTVVSTPAELAAAGALGSAPLVGLFAPDHLAYEIDRGDEQPSLADMTRRALDLLSDRAGERGFFVMIEGSRIDHAGHANDPAAHLGDILAYDAAVAEALGWAAADGETLVVSTADHETGGMTLGAGGVYAWDPAPLLAATASFDVMNARIAAGDDPGEVLREGLALGSLDAGVEAAIRGAAERPGTGEVGRVMRGLASRAATIGWTTTGHSAVDVGLYAFGPGADRLRGAMANDDLGRRLAAILLGD